MEEKKKAELVYKKIGRAWCPALNDCVAFTSAGIQHLIRKNGKKRSRREQTRRFHLLLFAKEIIESSSATITHRNGKAAHLFKRHSAVVIKQSNADFWALTKNYGDNTITVVIRQLESKEKHFFSIYDAKPKNQKTAT
jgi:hypothetical protein